MVGVGGGGVNAVNTMVAVGLSGVQFVAINTDLQSLDASCADVHVQVGGKLTKGLGAGADPAQGRAAAEENKEDIAKSLDGADMVFITAGMGGGTGTGASPIVAEVARAKGALVVGVVSKPFVFEGQPRMRQAEDGIEQLRATVDALIIVPNERLLDIYDETMTFVESFAKANDVLRQGVLGIAGLITNPGLINLDFADIRTIMANSGSAMMGIGTATGADRALDAAQDAINNPLLEETMQGATGLVVSISGGPDMTLHEVNKAMGIIRKAADPGANIIFGTLIDEAKQGELTITVIATGFKKRAFPPFTVNDAVEVDSNGSVLPLLGRNTPPEVVDKSFSFKQPQPVLTNAAAGNGSVLEFEVPEFLKGR
ncbi:cell division protein FtsZ [Candidatus Termititenax persephonae]|uniref:Cell division protein FtsZ n=1 Tax=Candidatus Termititenax persephonae TaxID=2218525 RepID=A0A388TH74_9BACT|nr:cell division protein FtsZ [Candidatus Termititenax persephonae]